MLNSAAITFYTRFRSSKMSPLTLIRTSGSSSSKASWSNDSLPRSGLGSRPSSRAEHFSGVFSPQLEKDRLRYFPFSSTQCAFLHSSMAWKWNRFTNVKKGLSLVCLTRKYQKFVKSLHGRVMRKFWRQKKSSNEWNLNSSKFPVKNLLNRCMVV